MIVRSTFLFLATALCVVAQAPTATVPYKGFSGEPYDLYPWFGQKVVFLTATNTLDVPTMNGALAALDSAWGIYEQMTGDDPTAYSPTTLNGRDVIAVVPDAAIPGCATCSYLGFTGSEMAQTYFDVLYNGVKTNGQYDQVMFYEFGRNFWFYGLQLAKVDPFVTGFAIGNRFVSMDRVPVAGGPFGALTFPDFQRSILIDLLTGYLNNPALSWRNTLLTATAPPNQHGWGAADLAGAMFYRIYADYGFDAYKSFWRSLAKQPAAVTADDTIRNFLAAANTATGRNYGFLFKDTFDATPVTGPSIPSITSINAANSGPDIAQNTCDSYSRPTFGANQHSLFRHELEFGPRIHGGADADAAWWCQRQNQQQARLCGLLL